MPELFNFKKYNAADWITFSRIIAVPVVIITTFLGLKIVTGIVIFLALCTDMADGYVARHYKMASNAGAKLDSVADVSLFLVSLFSIIWFFTDFFAARWWQLSLIMGLYFFQLIFSFIRFGRVTSFHTYGAKAAAIVEGLFITVCFFYMPLEWLFYFTLAIALWEQAEEITLMFILPRLRENVKGVYWVLKARKK